MIELADHHENKIKNKNYNIISPDDIKNINHSAILNAEYSNTQKIDKEFQKVLRKRKAANLTQPNQVQRQPSRT